MDLIQTTHAYRYIATLYILILVHTVLVIIDLIMKEVLILHNILTNKITGILLF